MKSAEADVATKDEIAIPATHNKLLLNIIFTCRSKPFSLNLLRTTETN
jgi:acyl-CoA synthetase (NDP forming)